MSDITERLRARPTFTPHDQDLLADAADAIESRDATIAELRAQVEALRADAAIAHELRKLAGAQKPMPADMAQILEDNLWDLLITDDAARSQEAAR